VLIKLKGLSSGRTIPLSVKLNDEALTVLEFLRNNGQPIASSCRGEGVCKLCSINKDVLSCKINVRDFLDLHGSIIEVPYL
jgi:uncharacterized 2Fe-2S/4Fe-4S cluster protein (DUF4445 family)